MASDGVGRPVCSETGLSVPECSCARCLEAMLAEVQPTLLAAEIRIARVGPGREEPGESAYPEAA